MTTTKTPKVEEKGLQAARRLAGWEIGSADWADIIIRAYLNPDAANELLDAQDVPKRTGMYR